MSPRRLLAALFPLALALAASAAPKWSTLQAPHCLIVSQLSERETRAWATEFEQFTAALRSKLRIEENALPPLTVVLFADSGTFKPYRPVGPKGKKRDIAGFFASRDTWSVIGLSDGFSDEQTRHVVLHEATHWLVSATRTELPLWLNEGFAEVFSTFDARKGYGLLGQPIPYHVATLGKQRLLPIDQLLLTTHSDARYTDSNRNPLFYAQAWLLTHQLLFQKPAAGHETLNQLFAARIEGVDQLTAFQRACGKDFATIAQDLAAYFRHGSFTFDKLPMPPEAKVSTPFTPASPYHVEIALARVAIGAQLLDLARTHLTRALALDPAAPAAQELLALIEQQLGNQAAAATAAQAALDHGSRDAWMHVLAAQALWRRANDRGELSAFAREIAGHYTAAIELQPKLRAPYCALAQLARFLPSVTQADAVLLGAGFKRHPDAPELLIGLAAVLQKGRNEKEAVRILEIALSRGDQLSAEQRATAEQLRLEWKIAPLARQIDDLEKRQQFAEALAACEQILQEPMQLTERRRWESRRTSLSFQIDLADARAAESAGNRDEAIRRLEALAARTDLSPYQRTFAKRQLERVINIQARRSSAETGYAE